MLKKEDHRSLAGKHKNTKQRGSLHISNFQIPGKLSGKTAIITGGDNIIAEAVAIAFAKEGARLSITQRGLSKNTTVMERIIKSFGSDCSFVQGDLGKKHFCKRFAKTTIDRFGAIDILVNTGVATDHKEIGDNEIDYAGANILGEILMVEAVLPYLTSGGTIINTAPLSHYTLDTIEFSPEIDTMVSVTRSLALSLARRGIRINAIASTAAYNQHDDRDMQNKSRQALKSTRCYIFLASEESSYLTGQILYPNGRVIVD